MFLDATLKRNPGLVRTTADMHRSGEILPNTYVLDLDAVEENARLLAKEVDGRGIELYFVCKQFGRNPLLIEAISRHIPKANAIDFDEARTIISSGASIGNLGHLVQTPHAALEEAMSWEPEVMTVYSFEKARAISEVAGSMGRVQPLLLRVVREGDFFYPAQEGGIQVEELVGIARKISRELPWVRVEGVTSFPCVLFDREAGKYSPTPNLDTALEAKCILEKEGITVSQVNLPSATCAATLPLLEEFGCTHAEPGHALTGTTPLHALDPTQPEAPAMLYVSEVSHFLPDGRPVIFGGGFYARAKVRSALVIPPDGGDGTLVGVEEASPTNIDYYRTLAVPDTPSVVNVGDTAILAFRTQVFVTRSKVAVVAGLRNGRPELAGVFDSQGRETEVWTGS